MFELWVKKSNPAAEVEAVRVNEDNVHEVAQWCGAQEIEEIDPEHPQETQIGLNISTPAGMQRATLGMYVVKYGRNFFSSHIRPFEEMYMPKHKPQPHPESAGDARKARGFADPFAPGGMG